MVRGSRCDFSPTLPTLLRCLFYVCECSFPSPAFIPSTPPPQAHLDSLILCFSSFSSTPLPRAHLKINTPTSSRSPDALWVFSSRCFPVAELADIDAVQSFIKLPTVCSVFLYCGNRCALCSQFCVTNKINGRRDLFVYLLYKEEAPFSVVSSSRTFFNL